MRTTASAARGWRSSRPQTRFTGMLSGSLKLTRKPPAGPAGSSLEAPGSVLLALSRSSLVSTRNAPPRNSLLSACGQTSTSEAHLFHHIAVRVFALSGKVQHAVLLVRDVHPKVFEKLARGGEVGVRVAHVRNANDADLVNVGHGGGDGCDGCDVEAMGKHVMYHSMHLTSFTLATHSHPTWGDPVWVRVGRRGP